MVRKIFWKTTWRSYGWFECEFGCLGNVHEYHFLSNSSSRKRLWHEFEMLWRIIFGKQRDSFSEKQKSWSVVIQEPLAWAWLISKNGGGCRQASCTVELINIPSSPTLYSVWERWETILLNPGRSKIHWYSDNNYIKDLNLVDGQLVEFEWKIFPGLPTTGIFIQIQQMMRELQCESGNFTGRIIFMSMFDDIVWDAKGNDELFVK